MSTPYLQVTSNGSSSQQPLTIDALSIGRQIGNMLVIDDTEASRFHCVVEKVAAGYRVRDLGSRNGTRVNGEIIKVALLNDGDVIQVGKVEMKLRLKEASGAAAAAEATARAKQAEQRVTRPSAVTQVTPGARAGHAPQVEDGNDLNFVPMNEYEGLSGGAGPSAPANFGGYGPPEPAAAEDYDDDIIKGPGPLEIDPSAPATDSLKQMADALPEHAFNHFDIALINARGALAHPSGVPKKKGDETVGEAVTLLRLLLLVCFRTRASDIHIEPKNDLYLVRVRIDGNMVDAAKLKKEMGIRLCAVIKILSDIDIAQRNIVQEGHFTSRVPDRRVDYRVSFTPAMFGQKCVVRVLDAAAAPRYLWDLGLPDWMFNDMDRTIRGDSGMVLVCGPTGSGKTASLYATLRSIDAGERNVITIEDPVEIQIEGITQIPVQEDRGNTFPALLRSVLRQDPDVILVGEIRDPETARTAIQASMTGHLVFSTVHARDTIGTVFRLLDLGIEPYLVSSGLQMVMAQRLVRQLCPHCRVGVRPTPDQQAKLEPVMGGAVPRIYRSAGCPRCLQTGFAGRRGLFELLTITESVRELIQKNGSALDLQRAVVETNPKFSKLMQSGYRLVAEGHTTMDEVERVVGL
jgi:general secretion pathway protein E